MKQTSFSDVATGLMSAPRYLVTATFHPRYRVPLIVDPAMLPELVCECGAAHDPSSASWDAFANPVVLTFLRGTETLGSLEIRGRQIVHALRQLGSPAEVRMQDLESLVRARPRNTTVVALKTSLGLKSVPLLKSLSRGKGNQVFGDAVDAKVSRTVERQIAGWLCSSRSEYNYRESKGDNAAFAVHALDLRLVQRPDPIYKFRGFAYYGKAENAAHLTTFSNIHPVKYREANHVNSGNELDEALSELRYYTHHYIVRSAQTQRKFKPFTKAFIAAWFGAAVVASADDVETELLPPDYPYLSPTSSEEDIRQTLEFAEESYLGPPWFEAVAAMKQLRELSCPVGAALSYVSAMSTLVRRG